MSLVRVFIATTTGPVAVQRITEEDPEVSSVVCLAGKAMALPISPAYDAFVRNPTGVVQRHFGHPAFRVDVSEKIDEGYSWQLGLFTAHALHKAERLGNRDDEVETVVVATGEVDRDLNVLAVNGISEKIESLRAVFGDVLTGDARLLIAVPDGDPEPWRKAFVDDVELGRGRVQVLALGSAADLLDALGAPLAERPRPGAASKAATKPVPPPSPRRSRTMVLAGLLTLVAMGALAGGATYAPEIKDWAGRMAKKVAAMVEVPKPPEVAVKKSEPVLEPEPEPKPQPEKPIETAAAPVVESPSPEPIAEPVALPHKIDVAMPPRKPTPPLRAEPEPEPEPEVGPDTEKDIIETANLNTPENVPVDIQVVELRAPTGHSCAAVRDKRVEVRIRRASPRGSDLRGPDGVANLCTIEIRAASRGGGQTLIGRYQRWTRSRPDQSEPDKVIELGPRDDALTWSVDIPSRLPRSAYFHIVVLSSTGDIDIPERLLRRLKQAPFDSPEMRKVVRRLRARGVEVATKRFRVNPGESRRRDDRRQSEQPRFGRPPPPDFGYPPPFPPSDRRGFPPPPPRS